MPENLTAHIGVAITIIWFGAIIVWGFRRTYGHTKTVGATVVNKQIVEGYSKYSGTGKAKRHYVTFQIGTQRKSFCVSEFSYKGYQIGEKGTLKYKPDRIIDFS